MAVRFPKQAKLPRTKVGDLKICVATLLKVGKLGFCITPYEPETRIIAGDGRYPTEANRPSRIVDACGVHLLRYLRYLIARELALTQDSNRVSLYAIAERPVARKSSHRQAHCLPRAAIPCRYRLVLSEDEVRADHVARIQNSIPCRRRLKEYWLHPRLEGNRGGDNKDRSRCCHYEASLAHGLFRAHLRPKLSHAAR